MITPTQTLGKNSTQRARACWLCSLILLGFLGFSVQAQRVLEASLSAGTAGEAQVMMGRLWLNFDAQGTGQFQAVIARVFGGYDVVSAQLERITWPTELGGEYLVQLKNDLNASGWVNTSFAIVGTSARSTIDIVVAESEQRFFRILRLH